MPSCAGRMAVHTLNLLSARTRRCLRRHIKEFYMIAQNGDTVKIHYTGTLDDGSVFDSSKNREPLQFVLGRQQVIPGFEKAVLGRSVGDKFTVTIPANEAYGESQEDLIIKVPREQIPQNITPEVGLGLSMQVQEGSIDVLVTEVTDTHITLDANHPLAGEDLTFDLEIIDIQ